MRKGENLISYLDWPLFFAFIMMLIMGLATVYSVAYTPGDPSLFDLDKQYGKQSMWIGISLFLGLLVFLIDSLVADGKKVFGYGASTKGNVLLQYCNLTSKQIPCIAEVNEDKYGSFTPGTLIPIISETKAKSENPDYFLVLPWHFKNNILAREQEYIANGGKFIFPLAEIEII